MVQKGRFEILYDNTLGKTHIKKVTNQKNQIIWNPQADNDNVGLFDLSSKGTYSGEIDRIYELYLTKNGYSGEAEFKYSKNAGDSYSGWDGNDWVAYTGSNARLVEFSDIDLSEGITVLFGGSESGEIGDRFTFKAEYNFPLENLHNLRPGKEFKSTTDQLNWEAVWDLGSYGFLRTDMTCLTGFNIPQLTIQANDNDEWNSPSISKNITFVDETGIINDIKQTRLIDNNGNWRQKTLVGKYIRILTGTAKNKMYKITDNYLNEIIIKDKELIDDGIAIGDEYQIISPDRQIKFDNEFVHRFLRMSISSGETAEGYYKGSIFKIGKKLDFGIDFQQSGYSYERKANVIITESIGGQEQINYKGKAAKVFNLNFDMLKEAEKDSMDAIYDSLKDSKTPFIFIPDINISGEVYPVRLEPDRIRTIPVNQRYNETWKLKVLR